MLREKEPTLTEEIALQNIPADTDALLVLSTLGFINPSKMEQAKLIQDMIIKKSTGGVSL